MIVQQKQNIKLLGKLLYTSIALKQIDCRTTSIWW